MPPDGNVYCAHCRSSIPRRLEREHRKLAFTPYTPPPPKIPTRLRSLAEEDSDNDSTMRPATAKSNRDDRAHELTDLAAEDDTTQWGLVDEPSEKDQYDYDHGDSDASPEINEVPEVQPQSGPFPWSAVHNVESDSEDDSDLEDEVADEGDEEDEHYFDWAALESNYGLSAWDRLGESFDRDVAAIGMCAYFNWL